MKLSKMIPFVAFLVLLAVAISTKMHADDLSAKLETCNAKLAVSQKHLLETDAMYHAVDRDLREAKER